MAHLSAADTRAARRKFEKDAAKALAELAHVLVIDYLRGWNGATKENIRLAEEALDKAYTIHRSVLPVAHVAESKIREIRGDLEGSIESLDAALALDPNLADAYAHKANAKILLGQAEEAPELLEEAIKRSSRDPAPARELGLFYWFMGRAYFNMGDYDKGIHWLKQSVDERPTTWFTWAHLISAYALTGRLKPSDPDVERAVNTYRAKFLKDWPLEKIEAYYEQPKYRGESSELRAALEVYISGLKTARKTAGVEVP